MSLMLYVILVKFYSMAKLAKMNGKGIGNMMFTFHLR